MQYSINMYFLLKIGQGVIFQLINSKKKLLRQCSYTTHRFFRARRQYNLIILECCTVWELLDTCDHSQFWFQFSHSVMSDSLWPHGLQDARLPCPSPTPGVYSNPCPSSQWCHPTISSSLLFSSCPQSLPASGSFPMSQLFAWGGQNTRVSASASVLPVNTQDWSPLGWTGWISSQSKGLSRVFSNTTVQKH